MSARQRVLFVAENVTLAQCVRLVTLARALDERSYEVHFACADFPDMIFAGLPWVRHSLRSLSAAAAERALEHGQRLYERATLLAYIEAERRLIDAVRPALVVGDFRWSLSTSAELTQVPCAVLINAYWSPWARRDGFPVPDHPIIGWLGESLTERYFPRAIGPVFRHFARPLDAAREVHGLPPLGGLLELLTHADHTLYPDDAVLTPVDGAPASHRFLGYVPWQPEPARERGAAPDREFERALDAERLVYVTLGSSGALRVLPMVVEALAPLPLTLLVATAGRARLERVPPNVLVRPFVPGADVARRARLVISNGGSTTGYQALAHGTPVLGLPSNLDQQLATAAIDRSGAGLSLKARQATPAAIRASVERALDDAALARAAREVGQRFARHDAAAAFRELVERVAR